MEMYLARFRYGKIAISDARGGAPDASFIRCHNHQPLDGQLDRPAKDPGVVARQNI